VLPALDMGGIETGTIELAHHLGHLGYHNFIASNGGKLTATLDPRKTSHIKLPLHSKNPIRLILNVFKLIKLIKKFDINIVHARSRAPAWSAHFACMVTNVPFITTFHGTYSLGGFFKKFYNSVMVRGQQTIAISQYIQKHIIENYSPFLRSQHIILINRGVDLKRFEHNQLTLHNQQKLRQHWNISTHDPLLIFPGRLTRWKGQLIALQALNILRQQKINFTAIFLGSAQGRQSYVNEMHALIKCYDLDGRVKIDQHCPDIIAAYQQADIAVHTAIKPEAFGRVITEAQAAKCLVIASACGAPQDIIQDGITGLLHQPANAQELAAKIKFGLQMNGAAKQQMVATAYKQVQLHYSNEIMFDKTIAVYKQALQERL